MPDYCRFQGETELIYPDFRDDDRGKTLVAVPGETYRVAPGMPGDGRWVQLPEPAAEPPAGQTRKAIKRNTDEPVPEPAAEPEKGASA